MKSADEPAIYYLDAWLITRAPFKSEADLIASGFSQSDVATVPSALLAGYKLVDPVDPNLIQPVLPKSGAVLTAASVPVAELTLPAGTIRNRVWELELTAAGGPVSIKGLTLTKQGFLTDQEISGVLVQNEAGFYLTTPQKFIDGRAAFNFKEPIMMASGDKQRLTIRLSLAASSSLATSAVKLSIAKSSDISADGAIEGSFPLVSAQHRIIGRSDILGNLVVSSVEISSSPREAVVGSRDNLLNTFEFVNSSTAEDVLIDRLTFTILGNARSSDLTNLEIIDESKKLIPATVVVSGSSISATLKTPYRIPKSDKRRLSLQTDIIGSENSTVQTVLMNDYDVQAHGAMFLYETAVAAGSLDGGFPVGLRSSSGFNALRIAPGQVYAAMQTSSPRGAITRGASDAVLAVFEVRTLGPAVTWPRLDIIVEGSGPGTPLDGQIKLRQKGGVILGSIDAASVMGTMKTIWLSSPPTLIMGKTLVIEVLGSVSTRATVLDSYVVTLTGLHFVATTGGSQLTFTARLVSPLRSVQEVELSLRQDPKFVGGVAVAGKTGIKVGRILIRTGLGESVLIDSITLAPIGTTQVLFSNGYSNLKLGGKVMAAPSGSPFVFAMNQTIGAAAETGFDIYVDTGLGTAGDVVQFRVTNVLAHAAVSKAEAKVQIIEDTTPTVTLRETQLVIGADSSFMGGPQTRSANTVVGSFILNANGAEDIQTSNLNLKPASGSADWSALRGYRNLRLVDTATGRTVGSSIASPVGGSMGDLIKSGPNIKVNSSVKINIVMDTRLAAAAATASAAATGESTAAS